MRDEIQREDNFILLPAASGGGALVRRSEVVGSRANGSDGCIIYLRSGPSVYSTASVPQVARYLQAEVADLKHG